LHTEFSQNAAPRGWVAAKTLDYPNAHFVFSTGLFRREDLFSPSHPQKLTALAVTFSTKFHSCHTAAFVKNYFVYTVDTINHLGMGE
jgi:hypothetical protein